MRAADARVAGLICAAVVVVVLVLLLVGPYPQPQDYFGFADQRKILGIDNFWNVISNATFLVPGFIGLSKLLGTRQCEVLPGTSHIYIILFGGILLTAAGSSWFHLAPDNNSLVWDRLPMTVVFMSLMAAVVAEHISTQAGRRFLTPLLLAGIASVLYWSLTELQGAGDLRFYALVQFIPMLLVPAIVLLFRSEFDRVGYFFVMLLLYALAKVFEFLDAEVYAMGQFLSGHTIKHIVAAMVPMVLIGGLCTRRRVAV